MNLLDSLLLSILPMQRLEDKRKAKLSKGKLQFAFKDDYGRKWYTFRDAEDMPLSRLAGQQTSLQYLASGLSGQMFQDAMETLTECLAKDDKVNAGVIVHDLKELPKTVLNLDTMISIIAYNYVREDEDMNVVTASIHQDKCNWIYNQIEKGSFFLSHPTLIKMLNPFKTSGQHLRDSLAVFQNVLRKQKQRLDLIRSQISERESTKTE